jgi:hypothetical protein
MTDMPDPQLMVLIDAWVKSRPRPIPPPRCSVCKRLWAQHEHGDVLACVKVLDRRADNSAAVQRYFLPHETKRHRENRFRRGLEFRRTIRSERPHNNASQSRMASIGGDENGQA